LIIWTHTKLFRSHNKKKIKSELGIFKYVNMHSSNLDNFNLYEIKNMYTHFMISFLNFIVE